MADVKLPNISQSNLISNGGAPEQIYADAGQPPRNNDARSHSFHSGRGGANGFG